jgi:hypothetical protein
VVRTGLKRAAGASQGLRATVVTASTTHPKETTMHTFVRTGALLAGGLLTVLVAAPADAAHRPAVDLRGEGTGAYVVDESGSARLTGTVTGRPFGGRYTAVLAADDGTLPEPGVCEPATATLDVTGTRRRHLELSGTGEVCGTWPDATYVVTHSFTGRYVVTGASARRLRGTDGWMSQILATEGRANVDAFDS